jgi:transcriptional regulator with XRE-family HTH domain
MLAEQCGKLIKEARVRKGLKQEDLANKAQVSRAVLSRLEQGKPKAVQSDTLDKLLAALEISPQLGQFSGELARKMARLEQEVRRREQRERHLRLAIHLGDDESNAAAKIAKARQRVELWRSNQSCSPFYIDRWSELLALPPRKLAKEMSSLGEWEDAMFQNSPWSWAWT